MSKLHNQSGFTLVEMMVATAITVIVLAAIFQAYQSQLRTNNTQHRIVEMNQALRTALLTIETDLRMAGLNPTGNAPAGITTAEASVIVMAMDDGGRDNDCSNANNANADGRDNNGNGLVDEGCDGIDNNGNGLIDEEDEWEWYNGEVTNEGEIVRYDIDNGNLRRRYNSSDSNDPTDVTRHIAFNIDVLNFVYLDGSNPPNVLATPVTGNDLEDIRSVQVTIIARDGDNPPGLAMPHTDAMVYRNPQGDVLLDKSANPDAFRRQVVTTVFNLRNMGLW